MIFTIDQFGIIDYCPKKLSFIIKITIYEFSICQICFNKIANAKMTIDKHTI